MATKSPDSGDVVHQSTKDEAPILNIGLTSVKYERSDPFPDRRYFLKMEVVPGILMTIKPPETLEASSPKNEQSSLLWKHPFQFTLFTASGVMPRIQIKLALRRSHWLSGWGRPDKDLAESSFDLECAISTQDTIQSFTRVCNGITCTADVSVSPVAVIEHSRDSEDTESPSSTTTSFTGLITTLSDDAATLVDQQDVWAPLLDQLERIHSVIYTLDQIAKIHPWVQLAWGVLSAAYKVVQAQNNRDDTIQELRCTVLEVCSFLDDAEYLREHSLSHQDVIQKIMHQLVECAYFIRDYLKYQSFGERLVKYTISGVDVRVAQLRAALTALLESLRTRSIIQSNVTVLQTHVTVCRVSEVISEVKDTLDANYAFNLLRDLQYTADAQTGSEMGCLEGTRVEVINTIIRWATGADEMPPPSTLRPIDQLSAASNLGALHSDESSRVLWICGLAGTGKSSIWRSVVKRLEGMDRLGAQYAFSADRATTNPSNLFSTIARKLADKDHLRKRRLVDIIKDSTELRETKNCAKQFMSFIVEPSANLPFIGETVIMIDAFDESAGLSDSARADVLAMLTAEAHKLPAGLRIIVTSRPEPDVQAALSLSPRGVQVLRTHEIPSELTSRDIGTYVKSTLREVLTSYLKGDEEKLDNLIRRAGESFQWASTACQYINRRRPGENPIPRLEKMLSVGADLGDIYYRVLELHFGSDPEGHIMLKLVLGNIMITQEPLSFETLSTLVPDDCELQREVVQHLGSLLSGTDSDNSPISPLHPSFRDYVCAGNNTFAIDIGASHARMALGCFAVMKAGLRFNKFGVRSSFTRNQDAGNLNTEVQLSLELSYSARFWAFHASHTGDTWTSELASEATEFFQTRFLWWLEVMSFTESSAQDALAMLSDSVLSAYLPVAVTLLVRDAQRFTSEFAAPIAQSIPHIYLSALVFAPISSPIFEAHAHLYQGHASVVQGRLNTWSNVTRVLFGHSEGVSALACSPDGSRLASSSSDGVFCLWDAKTGENIVSYRIDTQYTAALSLAFCGDGSYVISGNSDNTLRLWNGRTGEVIGKPWIGHTDDVRSVAWSHADTGPRVASGSDDCTVRLWDAPAGHCLKIFVEDAGEVQIVAFSPDGTRVVSVSADARIRLWDAQSGKLVDFVEASWLGGVFSYSPDRTHIVIGNDTGNLCLRDTETGESVHEMPNGHISRITAVAFSPDGGRIISGSSNMSVRVWDARSGELIGSPLTGHTNDITSVAFLPGRTQVVSSSKDGTVRVWDINTSNSTESLSSGHTKAIYSVVFSPDGKQLVSGSEDQTLRLWDVETGKSIGVPWIGHTDRVMCVAFAPDGLQVLSGSRDGTLRLWDVNSGQGACEPLTGHSFQVVCVAFMPDGNHLISFSHDMTVRLWDAHSGDHISKFSVGDFTVNYTAAAISLDGTQVLINNGHDVALWNTESGAQVGEMWEGHTGHVWALAFSADGARAISASVDSTLRLWDVETGTSIGPEFQGHMFGIPAVAFSPDGRTVVSGSNDKTVRLWDVRADHYGQSIGKPLTGHAGRVKSVVFSPDGSKIASASGDGTVRVWDVGTCMVMAGEGGGEQHGQSITPQNTDLPIASGVTSETSRQYPASLFPSGTFTLNDDGWILGPDGELILWVPSAHRVGLNFPHSRSLGTHTTELDFSEYVGGEDWAQCYQPSK